MYSSKYLFVIIFIFFLYYFRCAKETWDAYTA